MSRNLEQLRAARDQTITRILDEVRVQMGWDQANLRTSFRKHVSPGRPRARVTVKPCLQCGAENPVACRRCYGCGHRYPREGE